MKALSGANIFWAGILMLLCLFGVGVEEEEAVSGRVVNGAITADIWQTLMQNRDRSNAGDDLNKLLKPCPGIAVVLCEFQEGGFGKELQRTTSNASGKYAFASVEPGRRYAVRVLPPDGFCPLGDGAPNFSRTVFVEPHKTATADFSLTPGISLIGRITDASGKPVAGAKVSAVAITSVYWDQSYAKVQEKAVQSTLSGQDGVYRLHNLPPATIRDALILLMSGGSPGGVIEIAVSAEGYASSRMYVHAVTQALARDARAMLDKLLLEKNLEILKHMPPVPASPPLPGSDGDTLTGVDLALGVEASVSGLLATNRDRPLPDTALRMISLSEEKQPLDDAHDAYASNENLEGRFVYFVGKPLTPYPALPGELRTDSAGRFMFRGLSGGDYAFEAEADPGKAQRNRGEALKINPAQRVEDIRLTVEDPKDRLDVAGKVVDAATGATLSECALFLKKNDAPGETTPQLGQLRQEEALKGRFSITGISPGRLLIEVRSPGYGMEEFWVDLLQSATREAVFPLQREAVLTGRLTLNGVPKASQVSVKHKDGFPATYGGCDDKTGQYTIKELKAGDYLVYAYVNIDGATESTARCIARRVTLAAGQSTSLDLELTGSATLAGTLKAPKELLSIVNILTGPPSEPVPPRDSEAYRLRLVASAWDFRNGEQFRITTLPSGSYTVVATTNRRDGDKSTPVAEKIFGVTLKENQTVEQAMDLTK